MVIICIMNTRLTFWPCSPRFYFSLDLSFLRSELYNWIYCSCHMDINSLAHFLPQSLTHFALSIYSSVWDFSFHFSLSSTLSPPSSLLFYNIPDSLQQSCYFENCSPADRFFTDFVCNRFILFIYLFCAEVEAALCPPGFQEPAGTLRQQVHQHPSSSSSSFSVYSL